jgi:hypothetical protein
MPRLSAFPSRFIVVSLMALLLSCGGSRREPGVSESALPAPDSPNEEPPPDSATEPVEPHAKVVEVQPGKDDPDGRRVRIEFFNPTKQTCEIQGYVLKWASSSKQMPLKDMRIPPGDSRQRFLLVHSRDGEVDRLVAQDATIELLVDCDP